MLINNTFSKTKEEFRPINPPNVTMYVCGPTVYDYFHIGNARSFIMADIIRRYLEFKGYSVNFLLNITDIEDKIIRRSKEENKTAQEVSEFYAKAFNNDLASLKVKPATRNPKATEHINEMISIIAGLVEKGIAYNVDGNLFYDVTKFPDYGKLSGKNLEELEAGARIEVNEQKKNPLDFALWKKAKEGEPSWDSPWGKGRPGWHIECSAMSTKYLGNTIDIHAGGNDLIFPHHENEIAQSEACFNQKFVKYWMHFGFLNIQNEKMSKSLGNFFTAREILKKYSAEAIRLFFAQTYYGGPLNFSEELLSAAEKGVEKIVNLAEMIDAGIKKNIEDGAQPDIDFKNYYMQFTEVMDDDFNTSKAVAVIFDFVKNVNKIVSENERINSSFFSETKKFLVDTAENVLGIIHFDSLQKEVSASLENEVIELLLSVRNILKKEKNFPLADQIRNDLNKLGIELKDGKEGTTYKKK
ncbi:MAG: cysteine--tRNA ligase [Ignavibacteriales bacterium]|nr:cysteine--tRNA ligase [Ignavibacteriales bacterium]